MLVIFHRDGVSAALGLWFYSLALVSPARMNNVGHSAVAQLDLQYWLNLIACCKGRLGLLNQPQWRWPSAKSKVNTYKSQFAADCNSYGLKTYGATP
jgi:hypothetical protein